MMTYPEKLLLCLSNKRFSCWMLGLLDNILGIATIKALNAYGSLACKIPRVKRLRQDLGWVAANPYNLILLFLHYILNGWQCA